MFSKQIDEIRTKLNIQKITPPVKTFLSDFICQIGNYIAKNNLDTLLDQLNHPTYVNSIQEILEKVVKNQHKKKEKFELSFPIDQLQKQFSFVKKVKKEDLIRISATFEIIIGDILDAISTQTIDDIFSDPSNPFYDLFMITFKYENQSTRKSRRTRDKERKTRSRDKEKRKTRSRDKEKRKTRSRDKERKTRRKTRTRKERKERTRKERK
jgi:hypothetical protein